MSLNFKEPEEAFKDTEESFKNMNNDKNEEPIPEFDLIGTVLNEL